MYENLFTQLGKAKKLKMTPMPMKRMAPSGHFKKFMAVVSRGFHIKNNRKGPQLQMPSSLWRFSLHVQQQQVMHMRDITCPEGLYNNKIHEIRGLSRSGSQ